MKVLKELLPDCFLLSPSRLSDQRGLFVKTYHESLNKALGVNLDIKEEFYSISHKNVIRGMHFQLPPHEHEKLVYCTRGAVMDVLIDLRKGANYGKVACVKLSGRNGHLIYIPKGIAHGFAALTDHAMMIYKTSAMYAPEADSGIRWDSFGYDWGVDSPIMSMRDQQHVSFSDFHSPF